MATADYCGARCRPARAFEKATNSDIAAASGIGSPGLDLLLTLRMLKKATCFCRWVEQRLPVLQLGFFTHSEEIMTKAPRDALPSCNVKVGERT